MRRAAYLAVALVVLAGGGVVASQLIGFDRSPFVAEAAELRETEVRLDVVVEDLRRMRTLPGVELTTLSVLDCRLDSGDLFQPSALGHWQGTEGDAASAAAAVADALRTNGWTASGEATPSAALEVTKAYDGWRASGFVGPMRDRGGAYVDIVIVAADPCSVADG